MLKYYVLIGYVNNPSFSTEILEKKIIFLQISKSSIPLNFTNLKHVLHQANDLLTRESVRRPKRLNESINQMDWSASSIIEANDTIESELNINELHISDSFSIKTVNGHRIEHLIRSDADIQLNNLTVLIFVESFEEDEATRSKRESSQILNLGNVELIGRFNNYTFPVLIENALKTNDAQEQRLESVINFNKIRTDSISIQKNRIIGREKNEMVDLNRIVVNTGDENVVNQIDELVFWQQAPQINEINILQRIGHIQIFDGRWNILFQRSKHTQIITGNLTFESVNLIEPITLQGKINVQSPAMNRIKPIVTVDDELTIDGDVVINGNVSVKMTLAANNIFGRSVQYSLIQLQGDGLRIGEPNIEPQLQFVQPIRVENILASTRLNDIPIESFVKRNTDKVQKIIARKTIVSDLSIANGDCNANEVNGINLALLNNTMLKRTASNQVITGTIQIKRIVAEQVKSGAISFKKIPIDRFLTKSTNQMINGNVTVHGTVLISNGSILEINQLITQNNVLGVDMMALFDDSYANESAHLASHKWFENVTIDQLIVECDFWHVAPTDAIVNRLENYSDGVSFNGSLNYGNQFSINELYVFGQINDIPSSDFGRLWLLLEGNQVSYDILYEYHALMIRLFFRHF